MNRRKIMTISDLRKTDNFFLLAGPCVIEGEEMALRIADRIVKITDKLGIPYVFKGSYRKANRSRLDSFTGIGDEKALKVLRKIRETFDIPIVTDIHSAGEAAMAAEYVDCRFLPFFVARLICWWRRPIPERLSTSRKDNFYHLAPCVLLLTKWWRRVMIRLC